MSSELDEIEARFLGFAHFSPSPLYRSLSAGVAGESDVTGLLLEAAPDQRWPMLLLAAVHLLTRRSGEPYPRDAAELVEYCRSHRDALLETIRGRSTQTNEVGRCSYLLPCLSEVADSRPLALIEVGTSRGLLLNFDRYRYRYSGNPVGDPGSSLTIDCELRSGEPRLSLPEVGSRIGVDLSPPEDGEWLRACAFADQPERLERLEAALAIAAEHPPRVIEGDALDLLPGLLEDVPGDAHPVVFHTAVLAYLPPGVPERLRQIAAGATYVTAEPTGEHSLFALEIDGERVGTAHPHGRWLEWNGR